MTLQQAKKDLCNHIMHMAPEEVKGIYVVTGNHVWKLTIRDDHDGRGYNVHVW